MNYELAKKLKDAGFPQEGGDVEGFMDKDCWVPTLSELIEACGNDFKSLWKFEDVWQCKEFAEGWGADMETLSEGKTPEEAVAKLWLELNKQ